MARLKQIDARTDLGYFGVGLWDCKNGYNVGGVIRATGAFNGGFVAVQGQRWKDKGNWRNMDTEGGYLRFPCYLGVQNVFDYVPEAGEVVAIERSEDAIHLADFVHPKVAMYLFGPEDGAIPDEVLAKAKYKVYIPTAYSLNLYSTASIVLWDRVSKQAPPALCGCPKCGSHHWSAGEEAEIKHCNACGTRYTSADKAYLL